jgi:hypothetical protein
VLDAKTKQRNEVQKVVGAITGINEMPAWMTLSTKLYSDNLEVYMQNLPTVRRLSILSSLWSLHLGLLRPIIAGWMILPGCIAALFVLGIEGRTLFADESP